ncbi:helix-turn-helix domain-containing protein [Gemmatimonadota bacterium]
MTVPEVAQYLGIGRRTVFDWIKTRGLPVVRISAVSIRFRRGSVDEWLARQEQRTEREVQPVRRSK